jgi:hypothetical protein
LSTVDKLVQRDSREQSEVKARQKTQPPASPQRMQRWLMSRDAGRWVMMTVICANDACCNWRVTVNRSLFVFYCHDERFEVVVVVAQVDGGEVLDGGS